VLAAPLGEGALERLARAARAAHLVVVTVRDDEPGHGAEARVSAVGIGPATDAQLEKLCAGLTSF
jgi:hypothetical protein